MNRKIALLIVAPALALVSLGVVPAAHAAGESGKTTVVLVHGAFADARRPAPGPSDR